MRKGHDTGIDAQPRQISRRSLFKGIGGAVAGACLGSQAGCYPATGNAAEVSPTPTPSRAEKTIGQDTEIAYDQLTMLEQTTSLEDMEVMSPEEFAMQSVADRAAYGYALVRRIIPESQQTYNVAPLDSDQTSFFYDQPSGTRSGNLIMAARDQQFGYIAGGDVSEDQARKLAIAQDYSPLNGGKIGSGLRELAEVYARTSREPAIDVIRSIAVKETGWIQGSDASGQKQWFKAIESTNTSGKDQTIQVVRATVRLEDGTEVFWYMLGTISGLHDGDLVNEYAKETIR